MPTYEVQGEFWGANEQDALSFLVRYFTGKRDGEPPYKDHPLIKMREKDDA